MCANESLYIPTRGAGKAATRATREKRVMMENCMFAVEGDAEIYWRLEKLFERIVMKLEEKSSGDRYQME